MMTSIFNITIASTCIVLYKNYMYNYDTLVFLLLWSFLLMKFLYLHVPLIKIFRGTFTEGKNHNGFRGWIGRCFEYVGSNIEPMQRIYIVIICVHHISAAV